MQEADVPRLALAILAAGVIVLCAALYAVCYALGRRSGRRAFVGAAYAGYAGVVIAALVLVRALDLAGIWLVLIACLLVGYLLAPRFIWRLAVAVHTPSAGDRTARNDNEE